MTLAPLSKLVSEKKPVSYAGHPIVAYSLMSFARFEWREPVQNRVRICYAMVDTSIKRMADFIEYGTHLV